MINRIVLAYTMLVFIVSCGGENVNFNEEVSSTIDTVSIDFENNASESLTPPKINFNNLVGGNSYVLHGNGSCTRALTTFTVPTGETSFELEVLSSNLPEDEKVDFFLKGEWSDGSDFCMSLDQSFKLLVAEDSNDSEGGDTEGGTPGGGGGGGSGTPGGGSLAAPTSIGLGVGMEAVSNSASFSVNVLGVEEGDLVRLFSDSSCSTDPIDITGDTQITVVPGETQVTFSLTAQAERVYSFYANRSSGTDTSSCTTTSTTFEFDSTPPQKPSLSFSVSEPGPKDFIGFGESVNLNLEDFNSGAQGSLQSVMIYSDVFCTSGNELLSAPSVISDSEYSSGVKVLENVNVASSITSATKYSWKNLSAKIVDAAGNTGECSSDPPSYFKIFDSDVPTDNSVTGSFDVSLSYIQRNPSNGDLSIRFYPDANDCTGSFTDYDYNTVNSGSGGSPQYVQTFSFTTPGVKNYSVRMFERLKPGSTCHSFSHTVTIPAPTTLTLSSPASMPSNDQNLAFTNTEGSDADILNLYLTNDCSGTPSSGIFDGSLASANVSLGSGVASGNVKIYGNIEREINDISYYSSCDELFTYVYDKDPPGDVVSVEHGGQSSTTQYVGEVNVTAKITATNFESNELLEFYLTNDCSGSELRVSADQSLNSTSYQVSTVPGDDIILLNLREEIETVGNHTIYLKRSDSLGNSRCVSGAGKVLSFTVNESPNLSISTYSTGTAVAKSLENKIISDLKTTITADIPISSGLQILQVQDARLFSPSNSSFDVYIKINSEIMRLVSISGNNLEVERAQLGSTAASHFSGDSVNRVYSYLQTVASEDEVNLTVDNGSKFVASTEIFPRFIQVDSEIMKVISVSDNILTVERAALGTTRGVHLVNSIISKVINTHVIEDSDVRVSFSNLPNTVRKKVNIYSDPRCKLASSLQVSVNELDTTVQTSSLQNYILESGINNFYYKVKNIGLSGESECLKIPLYVDPIEISNVADLSAIQPNQHYILTQDIDLSENDNDCSSHSGSNTWTPLFLAGNAFSGSLYGNGKTICGMNVNVSSSFAGLFERLGTKALIYSLKFKGANIQNTNSATSSASGVLAGYGRGTIERVEIDNTSTVKGEHNVGGLVGIGEEIAIRKSSSGADVSCVDTSVGDFSCGGSGRGTNVGGLVGHLRGIEEYYTSFGQSELPDPSSIADSYSTGDVVGRQRVGGLVGYNEGILIFTYSSGFVSGDNRVGGLIGETEKFYGTYLTYSFSTSSVTSNDIYTGAGLIGLTDNQNGVYGGWHTDNFCLNKDHGSGEYRSYSACSTSNQCAASSMGSTISAGADINNSTDTNISVDDVTPFYTCNETSIELSTGINDSAIEVTVSDSSTLAPGNFIKFGDEVMEISSLGSSNLINVSRGVFSSEKSSHSSGSLLSVCEKRKYIQIDEEVIEILDIRAGKVLSVNRGVLGTQVASHTGGSLVRVYRCLESSGGIETEFATYPSAAPSTKRDLTDFTTGVCSDFRFNCNYDWIRESGSLPVIRQDGIDFSSLSVTADQTAFNPGSFGVREAPLEIYSTKQFDVLQVNEISNSHHLKFVSDLNFSDPGAPSFEGLTDRIYYSYFSGVLDGGHHRLSGINQISNSSYIGGLVPKAAGAEIKNLCFDGIESSGSYSHQYEYAGANYGSVINKFSYGTSFRNLYFNNIKLSANGVYNSFISSKSVSSLAENIFIENSLLLSPNGTAQYNGLISGLMITGKQKKIHIENSRLENIIYYSGGLSGRTTADSDISYVDAEVHISAPSSNTAHYMIGGITGLSYLNSRYENISVKGEIKGNGSSYGGVLGVGRHSYLNNVISTLDISGLDSGGAPNKCGGAVGRVHSGGNQLWITNSIFLGNINCDGAEDFGITHNHNPTVDSGGSNIDNNYWLKDSAKVNTDEFCHRTDGPPQYVGAKEPPCLTPGSPYNFTTENEALDFLNFETIPSPISSAPGGLGWSESIWIQESPNELPELLIFD